MPTSLIDFLPLYPPHILYMSRKIWEVSRYSREIDTNAEKSLTFKKYLAILNFKKKEVFRVQEYFKIFLEVKIWIVGPLSENKFRVAAFFIV